MAFTQNYLQALSIAYAGDKSSFLQSWCSSQLLPDGRTALGRNWDKLGEAFYDAFNKEPGHSIWHFIRDMLNDNSALDLADYQALLPEVKTYLLKQLREWREVTLTPVRDNIDLKLFRSDGSVAGTVSDGTLSDGQRNTAALAVLLSHGEGPLILDQPEDELDSKFIYNELVPMLRKVKQERQLIFATHNANLPVNGDAELVYALEAKDGQGVKQTEGGLDNPKVAEAVLDIMEGSEEAFRRRGEKYHF
ncbi:AAA family ATPase [Endozoicomonas atrinae]|uniref:AAA family ATPase n=1 Tax=Endozoicomonas atrinae TaxID=1333660 RepID=UPI001112CBAC|nr:AAA family ATPase [Endozoicomonas atrinae]